MAVVHAGGTYVDTTFTGGTKANIIDNLETHLTTAGWTTISGAGPGSTNLLMESGTNASGYKCRVRLKDNGGSCAQVFLENGDSTLKDPSQTTNNGGHLLPAGGKTFRVIASKYQFLCYTNALSPRAFAELVDCAPISGIGVTEVGFQFSSSVSDGDGTVRASLKNGATLASGSHNGNGNYAVYANGVFWVSNGSNGNNVNSFLGAPRLIITSVMGDFASTLGAGGTGFKYFDNSLLTGDLYMAFGNNVNAESLIVGQLYDAIFIADSQPIDTTTTFSSHNWRTVTISNAGVASTQPRGGVWFATS